MDLDNALNPSQREAVLYNDGPSLIIAGAGSGKTRVLTYKIAYLLEQGVAACNILALTFTNKAAREMKERIRNLVANDDARYLWMGTFHSICARILRAEATNLGYTHDFSIYDTADTKSLIKQLCKENGLDEKTYAPNIVLNKISAAKNVLESAEQYASSQRHLKEDNYNRMPEMHALYSAYQARLRAANAMDFDDLLMMTCTLFSQYPDILKRYQQMFRYILVDEYQDTNYAQYFLVKHLGEPNNQVSVVGDDAQSIYSFRGADIRNILNFQRDYANARLFKLERNYRSTQTIVNTANALIHHNEDQIYKQVYSEKEQGERIDLTGYMSDREEAVGVSTSVRRLIGTKVSLDDIAILYRTNAQSRVLENEFRHLNIPYRIYGGTSFYQRKEIKDALAYFRLAVNPRDNEALMRIINFPARGIGDTTIRKITEAATAHNLSLYDVVTDPDRVTLNVNSGTRNKLLLFASQIASYIETIDTCDAYEFAELVFQRSGMMSAAALDTTPEGVDRKQNLEELLNGIHDFVNQRIEEGIDFTPIQDFLAEVSLLTDQDEHLQDTTQRVTLMTVHAAKGLEFKHVYIVGLEENLFPSLYCQSKTEIEEERRLLYVAITRAMDRCYLSYAQSRFKNGSVNFSSPSRFIKDLDRRLIREIDPFAQKTGVAHTPYMPYTPHTTNISVTRTATSPARFTAIVEHPHTAVNNSAANEDVFIPNDRVKHRVFGTGTVIKVYTENENTKIDIQFDHLGKKTLLLSYAKLEKINDKA